MISTESNWLHVQAYRPFVRWPTASEKFVYYSNKQRLLNESKTMDVDQVNLIFDLNENRGSGEAV